MSVPAGLSYRRRFQSLGGLLLKPIEWVLSLADVIVLPVQNLIGAQRMAYFFILPNLLIFGVFILLPMQLNFYYGFTTGDSILLENRPFIGTRNLENLLTCGNYLDPNTCTEDLFWRSLTNTTIFVVSQLVAMVLMPLLVGVLAVNYIVANIIAVCLTGVVNFLLGDRLVFRAGGSIQ